VRRSRAAAALAAWCGLLLCSPAAAAPPSALQAPSYTFAVIGDSGSGSELQYALGREMEAARAKSPFSLVLMLGDNLYGRFEGAESFRRRFEAPYAALLADGVKFHAVLGNHAQPDEEIAYPAFGMGGKRYYTFTEGGGLVQFFAIDSDRLDTGVPEPAQVAWLESALKASTARWKVAFFHHPMYNTGRTHGQNPRLKAVLEPLFTRYGVILALSGHEHVYQRLVPQKGVHYFISGCAGKVKRDSIDRADPMLAAGNDSTVSFMIFELTPDMARFRAIDSDGEVIDSGSFARDTVAPGAP